MAERDGCKGCAYVSRGEHEEPCVKCTQNASDNYKRMTNADRIRSMSDDELAEFFENYDNNYGIECEGEQSYLDWLQSEVEE